MIGRYVRPNTNLHRPGIAKYLSALSHALTYEPDVDLPRLAADYAFGISRNHPFRDGNKRAAFLSAVVFLGLNGLDLVAPEVEVVETMLALAAGELGEEEIAEWSCARTQPRPE